MGQDILEVTVTGTEPRSRQAPGTRGQQEQQSQKGKDPVTGRAGVEGQLPWAVQGGPHQPMRKGARPQREPRKKSVPGARLAGQPRADTLAGLSASACAATTNCCHQRWPCVEAAGGGQRLPETQGHRGCRHRMPEQDPRATTTHPTALEASVPQLQGCPTPASAGPLPESWGQYPEPLHQASIWPPSHRSRILHGEMGTGQAWVAVGITWEGSTVWRGQRPCGFPRMGTGSYARLAPDHVPHLPGSPGSRPHQVVQKGRLQEAPGSHRPWRMDSPHPSQAVCPSTLRLDGWPGGGS